MIEKEGLTELHKLKDMYQTRLGSCKDDKRLKETYQSMLDSIQEQIDKLEKK